MCASLQAARDLRETAVPAVLASDGAMLDPSKSLEANDSKTMELLTAWKLHVFRRRL